MHAATKAGTLGAGLLLLAVAVSIPEGSVVARAVATIVFLLLTAPIAAHVIARAAYHAGETTLWDRTCVDELADDRRRRTHSERNDCRPAEPSATPRTDGPAGSGRLQSGPSDG
jgi:multicomponent Na+:H+ antiporter subunit G